MEKQIDKLINVIKMQAQVFLLDSGEFYPFGTCIDKFNKIIPVGAYLGEEHSLSVDLINLLEKDFKEGINNDNYQIAAIAVDVIIRKNYNKYDGIEMIFFEPNKDAYKKHFKYIIHENYVEFIDYEE